MASFRENTHVFIVRIWREPREIEGAVPEWRGMIEHVGSGEQHHVKGLNEIVAFIGGYLETGTRDTSWWRRMVAATARFVRSWGLGDLC
jgi:hypothetical protein